MKIKCLYDQVNSVFSTKKNIMRTLLRITVGKEYIVYGLFSSDDMLWYYICDDQYTTYPVAVPAVLFEVTNAQLSRYWNFYSNFDKEKVNFEINFPEMREDSFYENLIEDDVQDIQTFQEYKKKIDLEFFDPNVTVIANIGDRDWLLCPKCLDAWNWPSDRDALVICPNCNTLMNNPRYLNRKS